MPPIHSALAKVGIAAAALLILSFRIGTARRPPEWFGIKRAPLVPTIGFIAIYLAWMLASDAILHWRGAWDFRPWQQAPLLASGLRLLAVCLLGPAVEELLFRGVIFSWLKERLPVALVIAVTGVGWALIHWDYSWAVVGVIAVDGILLGLARWRTASVFPPIMMHALYNLYAIW